MTNRVLAMKIKVSQMDAFLCFTLNRWIKDSYIHQFFNTISRLGDGVFWYSLMAVIPLLYGQEGFAVTAVMILMACWGVVLYKTIKKFSMRPRPFISYHSIQKGARTLDEFSFPSGHTMHATAFTLFLLSVFPVLGILLLPFALLTGLARVVLGVHYPTDVFMGAMLGTLNALLAMTLFNAIVL